MTLLDIETFLAVVKYGNFSTAAKNLYVSQPALTRRIQLMEDELGYPLLNRQRGHRAIQLTDEGVEFYRIAWKWQQLLEETNAISLKTRKELFSVAAVYSVSYPMLSQILPQMLKRGVHLRLYNAFSEISHQFVAQGLYDLAFIEQQDFAERIPSGLHTRPAFSESYVLVSAQPLPSQNGEVDAKALQWEQEIYVPWNNEYKTWHSHCFGEKAYPSIFLEDVSVLDSLLTGEQWAIVSYLMGERLRERGMSVYFIKDGPPKRVIYTLTRGNAKQEYVRLLLSLLDELLRTLPQDKIRSLITTEGEK